MRRCLSAALSRAPLCRPALGWPAVAPRGLADGAAAGPGTGAGDATAGAPEVDAAPKRPPLFSKKLTRKQRGSYADSLPEEVESWPFAQLEGPLYNTREIVTPPGRLLGGGPFAGVLTGQRALAQPQPLPAEQLQVGEPLPAPAAEPYQGATALLRWRTRIILSAGNDQRHPLSNKVEVTLQLRQLAREVGISQAGVAYIKALCASRYTPATDTLRLVSQRYFTREDNRRDLLRIVYDLVEEGAREGGGLDATAPGAAAVQARLDERASAAKTKETTS